MKQETIVSKYLVAVKATHISPGPLRKSFVADGMNTSFGPRIDAARYDFHVKCESDSICVAR